MFVGHLAVAMAAKKVDRTTSLVWYLAAANLVDLIWPILLLAGVERVQIDPGNTIFTPLDFELYPWTHSLLMGVVWGGLLGLAASRFGVSKAGAITIAALVPSHWLLDFLTHRPDLPLVPWGGGVYGLGLWNSLAGTLLVEGALWALSIALFLSVNRVQGWKGHLALWSFVLVSTFLWVSGPFSPPPPDAGSLAYFALIGWIILPWGWWIERTSGARPVKGVPAASRP
jgi:hypothetical protein